jgi:hypothetical protein
MTKHLTDRLVRFTSFAEFKRLASIETDDHVVWPHAKGGHRDRPYGQFREDGQLKRTHVEALRRRVPPPFVGAEARHGPGCPTLCLNYRHLTWGTRAENVADMRRDGTWLYGERNPRARLWQGAVDRIRVEAQQGELQHDIALRWGVAQPTISGIVARRKWSQ